MSDDSDIRRSVKSAPEQKTVSLSYNLKSVIKVLVVVLIVLISFAAGQYYGDHHSKTSTNLSSGTGGFTGTGGGGFRSNGGGFGTVSAVSASSITVADARTGTSKTYSITSSTKITDAGQSVSASSIATGDRVIIVPTTSGGSTAATILVNPSFGGGFGGGASPQSSGSSTSGSSTSGSSGSSTGSSTGSATTQ